MLQIISAPGVRLRTAENFALRSGRPIFLGPCAARTRAFLHAGERRNVPACRHGALRCGRVWFVLAAATGALARQPYKADGAGVDSVAVLCRAPLCAALARNLF